jgi:hypothetical protein
VWYRSVDLIKHEVRSFDDGETWFAERCQGSSGHDIDILWQMRLLSKKRIEGFLLIMVEHRKLNQGHGEQEASCLKRAFREVAEELLKDNLHASQRVVKKEVGFSLAHSQSWTVAPKYRFI